MRTFIHAFALLMIFMLTGCRRDARIDEGIQERNRRVKAYVQADDLIDQQCQAWHRKEARNAIDHKLKADVERVKHAVPSKLQQLRGDEDGLTDADVQKVMGDLVDKLAELDAKSDVLKEKVDVKLAAIQELRKQNKLNLMVAEDLDTLIQQYYASGIDVPSTIKEALLRLRAVLEAQNIIKPPAEVAPLDAGGSPASP